MDAFEKRKTIWTAISEFYLDTELEEKDYESIARTLKESNLSIDELKEIDLYEVFPTLQINLMGIAGEWAGFNEDWLDSVCRRNYRRKDRFLFRLMVKSANSFFYWMRKEHWEKLEIHFIENADKAKFEIHEIFAIANRGIVLLGEILEGKVIEGDFILFNYKGREIKRKIIGIDARGRVLDNKPSFGLLIECKNDFEIEELKDWHPNGETGKIMHK